GEQELPEPHRQHGQRATLHRPDAGRGYQTTVDRREKEPPARGWSAPPRVGACQGAVQPKLVPHPPVTALKLCAQSALLLKVLPAVRSGVFLVPVSHIAMMPKPALNRMVLLVRRVAGGTYCVSKSPTRRPPWSWVPAGLQLAELIPLTPPAYSTTTWSSCEPVAVSSQRPTQSPGAGAASPEVKRIGEGAVPWATRMPTTLLGGFPFDPKGTIAPGGGPLAFGKIKREPASTVSLTGVVLVPDGRTLNPAVWIRTGRYGWMVVSIVTLKVPTTFTTGRALLADA